MIDDIKYYYPNINDSDNDAAIEITNVETNVLYELFIQRINNIYLAIAYHLKQIEYFTDVVYVRQYTMINRTIKTIELLMEWYSNPDNQSIITI